MHGSVRIRTAFKPFPRHAGATTIRPLIEMHHGAASSYTTRNHSERRQHSAHRGFFFDRVDSIHAASFKFWNTWKYKMRSVRGQTSLERSAFSLPPHMNEPILTVAAERTSQLLPNTRSLKRKCEPTDNRSRILQTNKRNFHHIFQKNKNFSALLDMLN